MSSRTRNLLNFLLIFGTLAIVLIIGFTGGNDLKATWAAITSVPLPWILACLCAYLGFLLSEGLSIWYFLRRQGFTISIPYAFFVSIIGQYYSNITPGATGGQPLQVYYLRKKEIPVGLGTSALLVRLFCFQFMLLFLGTVFWILYADSIRVNLGDNIWILIVGYVYNAFVVTLLIFIGLNKGIVRWIVSTCIKIGTKLRICKDPEAASVRWNETVDKFHDSITLLRKRPADLLTQLLLGGAQLLSLMSVIYFLYRGFRLTGSSWGELTALAIMIYTSAGYMPLPGASGAQEGVFTLYLGKIFPPDLLFSALLLWRFFTYYVSLLLGAVVTVIDGLRKKKGNPSPSSEKPA